MYYEATDFLETAGDETLRLIARARELAREYSSTDYGDHEKPLFTVITGKTSFWAVTWSLA